VPGDPVRARWRRALHALDRREMTGASGTRCTGDSPRPNPVEETGPLRHEENPPAATHVEPNETGVGPAPPETVAI
jgi:hypothetical protein